MLEPASKVNRDPQDLLDLLDRRVLMVSQGLKEIRVNRANEAQLVKEVRRVRRVRPDLRGAAVEAVLQELKAQQAIRDLRVQPEIKDRLETKGPEATKD